MKKAMIDIWRDLKSRCLKTKIILQVHDELVFEVPTGEKKAVEEIVQGPDGKCLPDARPAQGPPGLGTELGRRQVADFSWFASLPKSPTGICLGE